MSKKLIKHQNWQSLIINKKAIAFLLIVGIPNWSGWASVIQLDSNNFNQYLNADHPVEGSYQLVSDIDLTRLTPWKPVGNGSIPFSVNLDGNYHVISGLSVSTSADNTASGLFGSLQDSTIRQILLNQPEVTSSGKSSPAGALAGEMKRSRIEAIVSSAGTIKTTGFLSHAGGIAGKVSDNSIIRDSLNTGTVTTTGGASAGGIAGSADQKSSISNDLNTGRIVSRNLHSSPAGGIVGALKSNSVANNNMNTGEVNVGFTEHSGGIVGEAETARILYNLNTGKISSDHLIPYHGDYGKEGGESGGIVGLTQKRTLVSKNLNTGSISTKDWRGHTGGITGQVNNASVSENVNAGTVTTEGWQAYSGGINGEAKGGSIHDNLNTGVIITKGTNGHVGGISGFATRGASVYNNVNTGSVEAQGPSSSESPVVARVYEAGRIVNNLNTFTEYKDDSDPANGQNMGVRTLSKSTLKSGLNGLSGTVWNAGEASQLPIPKGINTPYRELSRINGSKQRNNQFPAALNEFADPGGASTATSFNRTIWNSPDGYLPFLKGFSKPQTLLAGIDCTPGGFACSDEKDITPTPSAIPSSSARPSTTGALKVQPTSTTEALLAQPTSTTGALLVQPTSTTGALKVQPTSTTGALLVQPTSTTGALQVQPTATTGALQVQPTSTTGALLAQPTSTTGALLAQPTATTGALLVQPASTSELVTASETSTFSGSESPSATLTAFEISPSTSTARLQAKPSSSYTELPHSISPTTHPPSPSDNCPPPEGTPLFQTYDPTNQQIYVIIQPESSSEEVVLARYKGSELDEQFGLCGIVTYTTSASHSGIMESYLSLAGQVIHETTGSHLYLVVTPQSGKTVLLEFPLSTARKSQAQFNVPSNVFPENVQINDTAHHQGVMYLTGKMDNAVFVGRYHQQRLTFFKSSDELKDEEEALRLRVSPDSEYLYVTGIRNNGDAPYPVFIRQYDSKLLTPTAAFGDNGEEIMITTDTDNSQQDILMEKDWVYVAVVSPESKKLSIRRFATDNGQMDGTFIIDDIMDYPLSTPGSFSTVRLMTTEHYLHALIYNSNGQVSIVTYENQVNINHFNTTFKTSATQFIRPFFKGDKAYLAVGHADLEEGSRHIRMLEISLGLQNYMHHKKSPAASSSSDVIPGWGVAVSVITGVAISALVIIGVVIKHKSRSHAPEAVMDNLIELGAAK
ncbi:hypothetical protein NX722_21335 [Endozoicomonas gorgoniicola]|uniref:Uncharacterized protein n=1 Tax=Endozoicomonas gorgoniicola TaxID=1234144 RepID=A0ABT3N0I5_9GAMM|nr:hypothetical protein [Endozoicomonas gorgoniicola]MCW7555120.1 hypothetical protein [Endozoicomonas gorgoniicola]